MRYSELTTELAGTPHKWLVTGVAGFIGSHLMERLLKLEQQVVGLDNFTTGSRANLEEVRAGLTSEQWSRFQFIEGDLRDIQTCGQACRGVGMVLHQAAVVSVPQSMADPLVCHAINVTGFLNLLLAARDAQVGRLVFASSCAIYGDGPDLPKQESKPGLPLSPYAATKAINEIYAEAFARAYGLSSIGLRYFNVYGPRQDLRGAYASVVPRWISSLLRGEQIQINGDGETSRDFCFIENVIQANLLAATTQNPQALNQVYNIGVGERISLNQAFAAIQAALRESHLKLQNEPPRYAGFRAGDVRHSQADISKAQQLLNYTPEFHFDQGLPLTIAYYNRRMDYYTPGDSGGTKG